MFETFDTIALGNYLKELRISLSYSQKEIAQIAGISSKSLRRIEHGEVVPKYDTLVNLSLAYRKDLLDDLKNYRDSNVLSQYYSRLDSLILKYNLEALKNLESDFKELSKQKTDDIFLNTYIKEQFLSLLRGISVNHSKKYTESLQYFITAIKVSIPSFEPEIFESITYNNFEKRILMQIAIALGNSRKVELSSKILKKCLELSNFDFDASTNEKLTICKLYFQLAYDSHRLNKYNEVIKYSQEGINYCNKHNLTYFLAGLFYRRGIAEFRLCSNEYLSTLKKSITLLQITNNQSLVEIYINITRDNYGIELNIDEL